MSVSDRRKGETAQVLFCFRRPKRQTWRLEFKSNNACKDKRCQDPISPLLQSLITNGGNNDLRIVMVMRACWRSKIYLILTMINWPLIEDRSKKLASATPKWMHGSIHVVYNSFQTHVIICFCTG